MRARWEKGYSQDTNRKRGGTGLVGRRKPSAGLAFLAGLYSSRRNGCGVSSVCDIKTGFGGFWFHFRCRFSTSGADGRTGYHGAFSFFSIYRWGLVNAGKGVTGMVGTRFLFTACLLSLWPRRGGERGCQRGL